MSMLASIFRAVYGENNPPPSAMEEPHSAAEDSAAAMHSNWTPAMADPRVAAIGKAAIDAASAADSTSLNDAVDRLRASRAGKPVKLAAASSLEEAVDRMVSRSLSPSCDALSAAVDRASSRATLSPARNGLERAVDALVAFQVTDDDVGPAVGDGLDAAVDALLRRQGSARP